MSSAKRKSKEKTDLVKFDQGFFETQGFHYENNRRLKRLVNQNSPKKSLEQSQENKNLIKNKSKTSNNFRVANQFHSLDKTPLRASPFKTNLMITLKKLKAKNIDI